MNKQEIIKLMLGEKLNHPPKDFSSSEFAPSNIALCKYWGKRDAVLNLPVTSSLSISLGKKGATTIIECASHDQVFLNDVEVDLASSFGARLIAFLELFRKQCPLKITLNSNIPIAAGLASSACGFASIVKALNDLYAWNLSKSELSILARLGSGSACRSLWDGFVMWHEGEASDGMDSHGEPFPETWPELCVGLLLVSTAEKKISSREAMLRTVQTSPFYKVWPQKVQKDLPAIVQAINEKEFDLLGKTAESNALAMHAMMLGASPPIQYFTPATIAMIQKAWHLREEGLSVYFTQDAGPNLKLLFLEQDTAIVKDAFPQVEIVKPFLIETAERRIIH